MGKSLPMTSPHYRDTFLWNARNTIAKVVGSRADVMVDAVHDLANGEDLIMVTIIDKEGKRFVLKDRKDEFPTDQLLTSVALLWG